MTFPRAAITGIARRVRTAKSRSRPAAGRAGAAARGRRRELVRTAGFRLALFYAALFSVSVLLLLLFVYGATAGYMQRQLDAFISAQSEELEGVARVGGTGRVAELVGALAAKPFDPFSFYLVLSPSGRALAGRLPPRPIPPGRSEAMLPAPGGGMRRVRMLRTALPGGGALVVGRSMGHLARTRALIRASLGWALLFTLVLAVAGGVALGALSLRRVEALERALRQVMEGDLSRRLPAAGGRDELDRLAVRINALLDWLQAAMSQMQQVTNEVAHELRTPMARLRHGLEAARHGPATAACHAAALEEAIGEADAILSTFGALLRIAQIEAGGRRGGFRPVDLAALAAALHEIYGPVAAAEGRRLTLRSAAPAEAIRVMGDFDLLTQLGANLIENAIRHTPAGTAVTLAVRPDPPVLTVSDTGPGIPRPERAQVFRRFHRLDRSRGVPGSGLGLSFVAAVAALHGASVRLDEGETGKGLRVSVGFPPDPGATAR